MVSTSPQNHKTILPNMRRRDSLHERMAAILELKQDAVIYASTVYGKILLSATIAGVISGAMVSDLRNKYLEGFFFYLYIVSIIFLVYVFCYLLHEKSDSYNPKTSTHIRSYGSFILRFGAVIFGIGTVVYSTMDFCVLIRFGLNTAFSKNTVKCLNPLVEILFTTLQTYFICTHPRLNIHKLKTLARFGLMHMLATNLCLWFKIMVTESLHEIHEYEEAEHSTIAPTKYKHEKRFGNSSHNDLRFVAKIHKRSPEASGYPMSPIEELQERAMPFLLPLIIEYTLICTSVIYLMWKHVGQSSTEFEKYHHNKGKKMKIDCVGSYKGLVMGALTMAVAGFLLSVFYSEKDEQGPDYHDIVYLIEGLHLMILMATMGCICYGFHQIKCLVRVPMPEDDLSNILLRWSAFGWYVYCMFTTIAAALVMNKISSSLLVLVVSVLNTIQVTLQLFFMNELAEKQMHLVKHKKSRPCRQIITFLFLTNAILWLMYTFEVNKASANAVQVIAFGALPWAIILRVTLPLGIFYRFHSCVVFTEAWKNIYKIPVED